MKTKFILTFLGITILCACSSGPTHITLGPSNQAALQNLAFERGTAPEIQQPQWKDRPANEVAPGFTLKIQSPADSAVNGVYQVDETGDVKLPYGVHAHVAGQSTDEVQGVLNKDYQRFIKSPQINVAIDKREVFVQVRGLVHKPGTYTVQQDGALDELISKADGLQQNDQQHALAEYAKIQQDSTNYAIKLRDYFAGSRTNVPRWQGGETVFFQSETPSDITAHSRNYVQFVGQVRSPGEYAYKPQADFLDYLMQAGGPTDRADLSNVTMIRNGTQNRELYNFSLDDYGKVPPPQAGDVIIVEAENPSNAEKNGRVVGSYSTTLSAIATVAVLAAVL